MRGKSVAVGQIAFLRAQGVEVEEEIETQAQQMQNKGNTVAAVGAEGRVIGLIGVADTPRSTSAEAVTELKQMGILPVLLTGDSEVVANSVAERVGIERVYAGVKPERKLEVVRDEQQNGAVAMVGDGLNDAAALTQSDLGIAMGAGTDVAMRASDITLMRSDLADVPTSIRLARRTLAVIKGNLFWAFAYNVAAIPLAVAGLMQPVFAATAMAASSLFVVGNSLRLRRFGR